MNFLTWRARTARDRKNPNFPPGIPCCSERYRAGLSDVLSPAARRNCCLSRSSAADAIVAPNGGARVQRITLSAVSAGIPGRQGVRCRALLAAKSSGYIGNALQTGAAGGLIRATACPRSSCARAGSADKVTMGYVRRPGRLGDVYHMRIRLVARRSMAPGQGRRSSDSGDGGGGSEHQERGTHGPRPQQRVLGLNAHVRLPFLAIEV